jgi:hypothetical protein
MEYGLPYRTVLLQNCTCCSVFNSNPTVMSSPHSRSHSPVSHSLIPELFCSLCRWRTTTTSSGCKGFQIRIKKFHHYSLWAQDTFIQALSKRTSRKKTRIEYLKVEHVNGQCTFIIPIYFTIHRRKRISIASSRIQ